VAYARLRDAASPAASHDILASKRAPKAQGIFEPLHPPTRILRYITIRIVRLSPSRYHSGCRAEDSRLNPTRRLTSRTWGFTASSLLRRDGGERDRPSNDGNLVETI